MIPDFDEPTRAAFLEVQAEIGHLMHESNRLQATAIRAEKPADRGRGLKLHPWHRSHFGAPIRFFQGAGGQTGGGSFAHTVAK